MTGLLCGMTRDRNGISAGVQASPQAELVKLFLRLETGCSFLVLNVQLRSKDQATHPPLPEKRGLRDDSH